MHFDVMERIVAHLPDKEKFKIAQLNKNLREQFFPLAKWLYVREKTDFLGGISSDGVASTNLEELPRLAHLLASSRKQEFLSKIDRVQKGVRKSGSRKRASRKVFALPFPFF